MMKRWLSMVVVVSLLAGAGNVQAGLIFDNFEYPPGTSVGGVFGSTSGSTLLAQRFRTGGSTDYKAYTLAGINLVIKNVTPGAGTPVLSVFSDVGNLPGSLVGVLTTFPNITPDAYGIITFGGNGVYLPSSSDYFWAVLGMGTDGVPHDWLGTLTSPTALSATRTTGDWAANNPSGTSYQMQVYADSSAVPEPSTFVLFAGIMMGAAAYRRRRTIGKGQDVP